MKKRLKGIRLGFLGIVLGLALGLGITVFKEILTSELIGVLRDEIQDGCDCGFEVESASISLLRLRVVAKGAKVTYEDQTRLRFDKIIASFSIKDIFSKTIWIKKLQLINGHSVGALPGSPTYDIIDYIAEPIPPERDTPDRWKIQLKKLTVKNLSIDEELGSRTLSAAGADLLLVSDKEGNYDLSLSMKKLSLIDSSGVPMKIGRVSAELYLHDDYVKAKKIKISGNSALINSNFKLALDKSEAISGEIEYDFDTKYVLPQSVIKSKVSGKSSIGGNLDDLTFDGRLTSHPHNTEIIVSEEILLTLSSLLAKFSVNYKDKEEEVSISLPELSAVGENAYLSTKETISFNPTANYGKFEVIIDQFDLGAAVLGKTEITAELKGTTSEPQLNLKGTIESIETNEHTFPSITLDADVSAEEIKFNTSHSSAEHGDFSAKGILQLETDNGLPSFSDTSYKVTNFSLRPIGSENLMPGTKAAKFTFTGSGSLEGNTSINKLYSRASLKAASVSKEQLGFLDMDLELADGRLRIDVKDVEKTISAGIQLHFADNSKSQFNLEMDSFKPGKFVSGMDCAEISGQARYNFNQKDPEKGSGTMQLSDLSFGCAPYAVELLSPVSAQITSGTINLPDLKLKGEDSDLSLNGSISTHTGWDLNVNGQLKLNALLTMFPQIDDMHGEIEANLAVEGSFDSPKPIGEIKILDAGFAVESADILGRGLHGALRFEQNALLIDHVAGFVNDGSIQLEGVLNPLNLGSSTITLDFNDIQINPSPEFFIRSSGQLTLEQFEGDTLGLAGNIDVTSAEIRRNFNLRTIFRELFSGFRRDRSSTTSDSAQGGQLPDIELAVEINASRNIFLFSNLASAEFRGETQLGGTLQDPVVRGKLEALSGWFGITNRRFNITTGELIFDPMEEEPVLSMLAETTTVSRLGETTLVLVEVDGPISEPEILMTSDSGLPESEILSLLAGSGSFASDLSGDSGSFGTDSISIFAEEDRGFRRFLSDLTRIDEVSIEPEYNESRQATEPSLVITKRLSPNFSLVGQTFLGGGDAPARGSVVWSLTDNFNLSAGIETAAQEEREALFVDAVYTILSDQPETIRLEFSGNDSITTRNLREAVRLNSTSQIPAEELTGVGDRIAQHYASLGFFDAKVEAKCLLRSKICKHAVFNIQENEVSSILETEIASDIELDQYKIPSFVRDFVDENAEASHLRDITRDITIKLRSEGYIGARVHTEYIDNQETNDAVLRVDVEAGQPVTFVFIGNTKFKPKDFLDTINIFSRRQPFGGNTINILVENIERLYRENGYLFASVSFVKEFDNSTGRTVFYITIAEDAPISVSEVRIEGLTAVSIEAIRLEAETRGGQVLKQLFEPEYAVEEVLIANSHLIKSLYKRAGFPEAKVSYAIEPDPITNTTDIIYTVDPGDIKTIQSINVEGIPSDVNFNIPQKRKFSTSAANRQINSLLNTLEAAGYFKASVSSSLTADGSSLNLYAAPGEKTKISGVIVIGNSRIEEEVIRKNLSINEGDNWSKEKINQSRTALLRTGLFSRVDVETVDTGPQSKDIYLRVYERPLRTLRVGTGLNSQYGLRLFADATDKAIFGDGRTLNLRIDTYYDNAKAEITKGVAFLRYSHPDIFSTGFNFSQDLRFQRLDNSTLPYDLDRWALSSTFFRTLRENIFTTTSYTYQLDNTSDVPEDAQLSEYDSGQADFGLLSFGLFYDNRNSAFNPNDGYFASINNILSAAPLGSDAEYYQLDGSAGFLFPVSFITDRFILANTTRASNQWAFNDTDQIPISQRFFTGGRSTVRGFRENSLGPQGKDGTVTGGDFLFINNFELRYLLTEMLEVHGFLDIGSTFLQDLGIDADDLRTSAGGGTRFRSPIGPIGADLGFPLDERSGEPSVRFHFYIGGAM